MMTTRQAMPEARQAYRGALMNSTFSKMLRIENATATQPQHDYLFIPYTITAKMFRVADALGGV